MATTQSPALTQLSDCCIKGFKHTGNPSGKIIKLADLQTYLAEPTTSATQGPKKVLLFLSDVYGSLQINAKLLQDHFAQSGFTVVGPDFFGEDNLDFQLKSHPDWVIADMLPWATGKRAEARASFPPWLEAVKEKFGTEGTKYFAAGYCFGAPFACDLAATDSIEAALVAHPGFLEENHFKNIRKPLLLTCAEVDGTFPIEARRRAEDILVEGKKVYHIQVFGGVEHGFAVRGDLTNKNIVWAKEESVRVAIKWFNRFAGEA